jgi:hypothetical protein
VWEIETVSDADCRVRLDTSMSGLQRHLR